MRYHAFAEQISKLTREKCCCRTVSSMDRARAPYGAGSSGARGLGGIVALISRGVFAHGQHIDEHMDPPRKSYHESWRGGRRSSSLHSSEPPFSCSDTCPSRLSDCSVSSAQLSVSSATTRCLGPSLCFTAKLRDTSKHGAV
jgi:hypothetical protein